MGSEMCIRDRIWSEIPPDAPKLRELCVRKSRFIAPAPLITIKPKRLSKVSVARPSADRARTAKNRDLKDLVIKAHLAFADHKLRH